MIGACIYHSLSSSSSSSSSSACVTLSLSVFLTHHLHSLSRLENRDSVKYVYFANDRLIFAHSAAHSPTHPLARPPLFILNLLSLTTTTTTTTAVAFNPTDTHVRLFASFTLVVMVTSTPRFHQVAASTNSRLFTKHPLPRPMVGPVAF